MEAVAAQFVYSHITWDTGCSPSRWFLQRAPQFSSAHDAILGRAVAAAYAARNGEAHERLTAPLLFLVASPRSYKAGLAHAQGAGRPRPRELQELSEGPAGREEDGRGDPARESKNHRAGLSWIELD